MKKVLPFILATVFFLAACGTSSRTVEAPAPDIYYDNLATGGGAPVEQFAPASAVMPLPTAGAYETATDATTTNGLAAQADRMVIQNADLAIVVKDVEAREKEISDMAAEMGGFVVSSNTYQNYTSN
ncbi:MAG: hypothetical protein U0Z26_15920 [Anaerolineales bacterium]